MHLVPDPDIPTSETGTRHRTAERVARQIEVPVFTVSEEMGVVSVHYRGHKRTLVAIPRVLARADQALQILGRYKARLDGVTGALSALEVEDLVTLRDVATVLQRAEMVRRIADEIEGYVVELGDDGRLVELQLEELTGGVEDDRRLVGRDYFVESPNRSLDVVITQLADLSDEDILDLRVVASLLGLPPEMDLDSSVQPRGYRLLNRIPRLPEIDRRPRDRAVRPAPEDHARQHLRSRERRGRGRGPGPGDQGRPRACRRELHPRPLLVNVVARAYG